MSKGRKRRRHGPENAVPMHPVLATIGVGMVIGSLLITLSFVLAQAWDKLGHK